MTTRKWLFGVTVLALIGVAVLAKGFWTSDKGDAHAQGTRAQSSRAVPVEIGKVERKQVPVRLDALGTVTPIASVALKARVDTAITGVHFADGAHVTKGDKLFTLDCRVTEALISVTEGNIARDKAQLAGAQRDVQRYTDLVAKAATPTVNLDNAKTQEDIFTAAIKSDQGTLDNLRAQRSYCDVTAPITGLISAANVKAGNFVRQADTQPMATIIQMAPVYVSFTVPQKNLPAIRDAISAGTASVQVMIPGQAKRAEGKVSMIENTIDPTTGMATLRATMPNTDELLWPGTLVTAEMTLRSEEAVVVPSTAIQVSQTGSFVFLVDGDQAKVQPVKVERQVGDLSIVTAGLKGGETVVTDGQLQLSNGSKVSPRPGNKPVAQKDKAEAS